MDTLLSAADASTPCAHREGSRKSFFGDKLRGWVETPLIRPDPSLSTHETSASMCCLRAPCASCHSRKVRDESAQSHSRSAGCVCLSVCICAFFFFMHMCEIDRGSCSVSCRITSISQKLTGDNEKEGDMAARSRYTHSASRAEPANSKVCECTRAITIRHFRIRPCDVRRCD